MRACGTPGTGRPVAAMPHSPNILERHGAEGSSQHRLAALPSLTIGDVILARVHRQQLLVEGDYRPWFQPVSLTQHCRQGRFSARGIDLRSVARGWLLTGENAPMSQILTLSVSSETTSIYFLFRRLRVMGCAGFGREGGGGIVPKRPSASALSNADSLRTTSHK
jgi:hypothetical protein